MNITEFISQAPAERQSLLTNLHQTILANDPTVIAVVKPMMGKEIILYEQKNTMKYGLACAKKHMSFHCLPMYMKPEVHQQFEKLLPEAKFQKGCINFETAGELPLDRFGELIAECAPIDIAEVLEKRKK